MKLCECKIGTLVICNGDIGHIVGLEYSLTEKEMDAFYISRKNFVIPIVKFANGSQYGVHHDNLELLTEFSF